jgi:hypothetical protein
MSAIADMGAGMQAAWLLARGQRAGIDRLTAPADDLRMATRSFWALPLCLPAFICLHLLDWAQVGAPAHPARHFTLDLICFGVYWVGFAVLSHAVAGAIGRPRLWPRYIALWNWCNLVQYMMQVAAALPLLLGMPDWASQTAWLVALGWALWLEWFAAKLSLDIGGLMAAGFTGFDFVLGLFLFGLVDAISR